MKPSFDFVRTGPGTIAGRYLRQYWQPIYVSSQLPKAKPLPLRIMSEDFTLYRGEGGAPHLVTSRCPHRLTQLSIGWVEGESIRCRYHGWRFESSGACVEQPSEPKPFCDKIRIASYPLVEHLGLIFGYLGEGAPPPFPRWSDADEISASWEGSTSQAAILPCNYFQSAENIMDDAHVSFAHSGFPDEHGVRIRGAASHARAEETPFGLMQVIDHPDRPKDHPHRVTEAHFIMPNRCHIYEVETKATLLFWYVPIDDETHYHFLVYLPKERPEWSFHPSPLVDLRQEILDVLRGKRDANEFVGNVRAQDGISIAGQGAIAAREGERLGQSDSGVILLRKLWQRELARLANNEATTPFVHPDYLFREPVTAKSY